MNTRPASRLGCVHKVKTTSTQIRCFLQKPCRRADKHNKHIHANTIFNAQRRKQLHSAVTGRMERNGDAETPTYRHMHKDTFRRTHTHPECASASIAGPAVLCVGICGPLSSQTGNSLRGYQYILQRRHHGGKGFPPLLSHRCSFTIAVHLDGSISLCDGSLGLVRCSFACS